MLHTHSLIREVKLYHLKKTFIYGDLLKFLCAYSLNFVQCCNYLNTAKIAEGIKDPNRTNEILKFFLNSFKTLTWFTINNNFT